MKLLIQLNTKQSKAVLEKRLTEISQHSSIHIETYLPKLMYHNAENTRHTQEQLEVNRTLTSTNTIKQHLTSKHTSQYINITTTKLMKIDTPILQY